MEKATKFLTFSHQMKRRKDMLFCFFWPILIKIDYFSNNFLWSSSAINKDSLFRFACWILKLIYVIGFGITCCGQIDSIARPILRFKLSSIFIIAFLWVQRPLWNFVRTFQLVLTIFWCKAITILSDYVWLIGVWFLGSKKSVLGI